MKKLIIFLYFTPILLITSCSYIEENQKKVEEHEKERVLKSIYLITLYSDDGKIIKTWEACENPAGTGTRWWFTDVQTQKCVEISGTVIAEPKVIN